MECLVHHGIKGQKWGVRRYQNSDGTLTEEGLKRYKSSGEMLKKQSKKVNGLSEKLAKSNLLESANKLNEQSGFTDSNGRMTSAGKDFVDSMVISVYKSTKPLRSASEAAARLQTDKWPKSMADDYWNNYRAGIEAMERGDVRAAQAISMRCEAIAAEAQFETLYGNNLKNTYYKAISAY